MQCTKSIEIHLVDPKSKMRSLWLQENSAYISHIDLLSRQTSVIGKLMKIVEKAV